MSLEMASDARCPYAETVNAIEVTLLPLILGWI